MRSRPATRCAARAKSCACRSGPALLGRVVDPLGRPLDGKGPVAADTLEPIERPAPAIIDRDLVAQPVQTGLVVVDTLFALGRGQRELIIGDRAIGKTTIAIDTIINQKTSDIVCVYVAVGQKSSSVRRAIDAIQRQRRARALHHRRGGAGELAGLQWIAPFAGFTMAEYFRDRGRHALVVVDDLTKHAATHREIALLTRQSPGREAYPGDVFYVHARLLERAAKLSKEKGGGSLTALPIAETDAGNLSAYIPTNLISITDGQIVLDAKLFYEGQKPAVDVGTSVSRVGGKTQAHALREAAETLRLDYAQFLELEMFTRFGGMPDARVRKQLTRGARIRAILDQPQHAPLRLADEVALVLAVQSGLLDALPLPAVAEFRRGLRDAIDRGAADAVRLIQETGTLDDARKQALRETLATAMFRTVTPDDAAQGGRPAMTERLADIGARIDGIRQLGAVVNAMRGIAAARAQQARSQLVAVDGYAATIAAAIGRALALVPRSPRRRASIGPAGARAVLRRAGICRRLQRARARCRRRRSRHVRAVPDRHPRRRGRRRTGRRGRLERRHAVAFARHPQARRPHRRSALRPHRQRRDRPARRRLQPMAAGPRHPCGAPPAVSLRHVGLSPSDGCQRAAAEPGARGASARAHRGIHARAALQRRAPRLRGGERGAHGSDGRGAQPDRAPAFRPAGDAAARSAGGDHGGNHRTCRRRDGEPARLPRDALRRQG